jgi:hypothetical protein
MLIQPNAYVYDMDNSKARRIAHEVLPTEYRWDTHHVSEDYRAAIPNVYFMVRMNLTEEEALVLWLNSF